MDGGTGTALRPKSPQTQATWDTSGKRSLSLHMSRYRRPHPLESQDLSLTWQTWVGGSVDPGRQVEAAIGECWAAPAGPLRGLERQHWVVT